MLENNVIFEYVEKRTIKEGGFKSSIISMYERNRKWSSLVVRSVVWAFGLFYKPRRGGVKYYFWGVRFQELILTLPHEEVCIVGGPRQLAFCAKNNLSFLPEMRLWSALVDGLRLGLSPELDQLLSFRINKLGRMLYKFAAPGAVLIVENDSLPMQRVAIKSAWSTGMLQVICVQDGIFQRASPSDIMHGWFADWFFVIDDNQKKLLIEKGMPPAKIKVMGFHSSPYIPQRALSPVELRKVCFIGQPWGKYGDERGKVYLHIVQKVICALKERNYPVYFKPHPWEKECSYLNSISNVVDVSMEDALEKYDVFISLTSTALLEAISAGRLAVQVFDSHFDADRFSDFYSVKSIDFDDHDFEDKLCNSICSGELNSICSTRSLKARFFTALTSL